jgi:hypothetical protein
MRTRIAGVLVIVVGLVVGAVVFTTGLFTVAPAFEELTDGFRPVMQDEALAAAEADVAALGAVSDELGTAVIPQLAQAFELSPEQFQALLGEQFPAVAAGAQALPEIVPQFTQVVGLLQAEQARFESADAIPTDDLPATTMPWIILAIALAMVAVGGVMVLKGRLGSILAIVLGALVIASSLALSFLPKSADADEMNENLKPVYTAELVAGAEQSLQVVGAMGDEMQTKMLGAVGQQLGMDEAQLNAFLGENFPATAGALQELPAALGRFTTMVTAFDGQLDNYDEIKNTALNPVAWIVLIAGIMTLLLGAWGVLFKDESVSSLGALMDRT